MSWFGGFLFVFALLASIGLHEFGHFITAKKFGIKVHQFFIGFGPKIWSIRRGETEYGVKALPLGGFVRIAGMNPFEEIPPEDADRVFKAKKPWKRAIVLAAGSFTHFLLAFVIVATLLMAFEQPDYEAPTTTVAVVTDGSDKQKSPAERADIRTGDTIIAIEGKRVRTWKEVVDALHVRPGKRTVLTLRRNGETIRKPVVLAKQKPDGEKVGYLGVSPEFQTRKLGPIPAITEAGKTLGYGVVASLDGIRKAFSPSSIKRLFQVAVGGGERSAEDPATVVGLTGQAASLAGRGSFDQFLFLIAAFNIFIGVANLLPLPPLDGGHLAVLAFEKITRREVDVRRLIPITAAVISAFGSLFLLLLYLDIVRPLPPVQ